MEINWSAKGIDISQARGGKMHCPQCHHTRKNKTDKSLSVNKDTGLYHCHNGCGFSGSACIFDIKTPKKEYQKPAPRPSNITEKAEAWFLTRGISIGTLRYMKVTTSNEWMPGCEQGQTMSTICFNYYRGEELVNIKFRTGDKKFKMAGGAELIFYNLNATNDYKEIIIVEGEMDALSFVEAGIYNVVSVPNGASKGTNARLEYLDNCWQDFEQVEKIIIATDNDEPGIALKEELIRRLGVERCFIVEYPLGCKDANDVLLNLGKDALKEMVEGAKSLPISGVVQLYDFFDRYRSLYLKGRPEPLSIDYTELNDIFRWQVGQLTTVTGTPNSGKSTWLNNVLIQLAMLHGWKMAMYTPEKEPIEELAAEITSIYTGKPFTTKYGNNMTEDEFIGAAQFIDANFFFMISEEINSSVEGIIAKAKELVRRHGINALVIDPWNYVEHDRKAGQTETEYVSAAYSLLKQFSKNYKVHVFVVAHPAKMKKIPNTPNFEIPSLYDISGSAHFYNKTDNGIVVYRDLLTNITTIYVQKVRWSHTGKIGNASMYYDVKCSRFTEHPPMQYGSPEPTTQRIQPSEKPSSQLPSYMLQNSFTDDPF